MFASEDTANSASNIATVKYKKTERAPSAREFAFALDASVTIP